MLQYSATTLTVPFDSNYKNVIDFGTADNKKGYFAQLLGEVPFWSPISNFNVGDGIATEVVYDAPDDFNLFTQLNVNYMIIKDSDDNFYYYFIKRVQQLSNRRFKYNISIDIFTQYFDPQYFENTKYLIKRAHLDRFNSDTTISDYMFSTPPVHSEEVYNSDIITQCYDNAGNVIENLMGWKYIFINNNKDYNSILTSSLSPTVNTPYGMRSERLGNCEFGLIVEPVLKDRSLGNLWTFIHNTGTGSHSEITTDGTDFERIFRNSDADASYIYCIKILPYHPFPDTVVVDYVNRTVRYTTELCVSGQKINNSDPKNIITVPKTLPAVEKVNLTPTFNIKITKGLIPELLSSEITDPTNTDEALYPKLWDGSKAIDINYFTSSFTINVMRFLHTKSPGLDLSLECSFAVTPIDTGLLVTIPKELRTRFSENISDYYGLLASMNSDIQVANSVYAEFIANNRNFNLQFESNMRVARAELTANTVGKMMSAAASVVGAGVTGDPLMAVGAVMGVASAGINGIVNQAKLANIRRQFVYEIDNYKGAPSKISSGQTNVYLVFEKNLFPFLTVSELLPQTKKAIIDEWKLYGYEYNVLDTVAKWYNSRKYHNYVQAVIEDITAPWSLNVKELFKIVFANGVRFWHYNNGEWNGIENYVENNYERIFD